MDDYNIFKLCRQKENEINSRFQLIEDEQFLHTNQSESYCTVVQELFNEIQAMYCMLMQCYNEAYNIIAKTEENMSQSENELKVRCEFSKDEMDNIDVKRTCAFDYFFATLKELMRLASSFINFVNKLYPNDHRNEMQTQSVKIYEFAWEYINIGLKRSFTFTVQTPLLIVKKDIATNRDQLSNAFNTIRNLNANPNREVPKCSSKFDLEIKCYCSNFLISHTGLEDVPLVIHDVKLYNEEDVQNNLNGEHRPILEEMGTISYDDTHCKFTVNREIIDVKRSTARVRNIRVTDIIRPQQVNAVRTQRRDHAHVDDTRYCLTVSIKSQQTLYLNMNETIFPIDLDFQLTTLPFCVLTNQNQRSTALPRIFWFRIFPRCPQDNEDPNNETRQISTPNIPTDRMTRHENQKIKSQIFIYRLNELFKLVTGCGDLPKRYQNHIAFRLFGQQNDYNSCCITFDTFYNNFMQDHPNIELTFWKWLYAITELISKSEFKLHWNQGIILLISREELEKILMSQTEPVGAFRQADTVESALIYCIYIPGKMNHVAHICLKPFLDRKLSLYQAINLMGQQYKYLYQIKNIIQLQDNEFVVKPIQQFIAYDDNLRVEFNVRYIIPILDLPLLNDNRLHNFLLEENNLS